MGPERVGGPIMALRIRPNTIVILFLSSNSSGDFVEGLSLHVIMIFVLQ